MVSLAGQHPNWSAGELNGICRRQQRFPVPANPPLELQPREQVPAPQNEPAGIDRRLPAPTPVYLGPTPSPRRYAGIALSFTGGAVLLFGGGLLIAGSRTGAGSTFLFGAPTQSELNQQQTLYVSGGVVMGTGALLMGIGIGLWASSSK